jgi:flagellar biogenesis protein FliO
MASTARAQATSEVDLAKIEQLRDAADESPSQRDASPQATAGSASSGSDAAVQAEQGEPELPANESLPLGVGSGDLFANQGNGSATGSMSDGWFLNTLAALGVVLALVFLIRWLLKRGGVVSTIAPQGAVVEVLSRTTVAPRSHVLLLRVGTRILVVNDSTNGMRTLAAVEDAEEVAELLGSIESAKAASMTESFGSAMKKLSTQWSADDETLADPQSMPATQKASAVDEAAGVLSQVRGRLAALSETGGRS